MLTVVNMVFSPILALGLNELVTALVLFASLAIWVLSQIADAKKKQAAPPPRAVVPPPGPGDRPAMAQAQPAADALRAQVDDFLRRAAGQGPPQGVQPAPRPAIRRDEIEVLVAAEPAEAARPQLAKPLRPIGGAAAAAPRQVPKEPPRMRPPRRAAAGRPQSVAEHVAAHVGAAVEQIRQEVSDLGEAVITADREFDVQLQQKFDHQLGSLRSHSLAPAADQPAKQPATTPASEIAAMLASPAGVRQAIIVNEILRRPDERW
jgi:hypothetical protein